MPSSRGRGRLVARLIQVPFLVGVAVVVWLVADGGGNRPMSLVPDTQPRFSLDLSVVGSMQHDVVFGVEQRARPAYRIFSFDPATGTVRTVFTVPAKAIVYGIALSPDRTTLAVAYSPDFSLDGSGLATLDLKTRTLTQVMQTQPRRYLTDVVWSPDGTSVLGTYVDRTGTLEELALGRVTIADGALEVVVRNAVAPVIDGPDLYYLTVDKNQALRGIGHRNGDTSRAIRVGSGTLDLDHLVPGTRPDTLNVAVLDSPEDGLGAQANAHGNHDVPSTWWTIPVGSDVQPASPRPAEPVVIYDADTAGGAIVTANQEGLSIETSTGRRHLIASRAIRFVTA